MKRSYDTVASFYDRFARLVFGQAQINAQRYLLKVVPQSSSVLIIGGGTGWILEEIAKLHRSGLSITYADASAKMIDRARKRNAGNNNVTFVARNMEDVELQGEGYDIVLTPFLFDNLDQGTTLKVCSVIGQQLRVGGLWLYCDFDGNGTLWQRGMLGAMYLFFRSCCGIKAKWMPDMSECFAGYRMVEERRFYGRFIIASVYEKL